MNYFSSDYLYILKAAFSSEFFWSLLYSVPCILFFIMFCIFIVVFVFLLIEEKRMENKSEQNHRAQTTFAAYAIMLISLPACIVFIILTYLCLPTMKSIQYKNEYLPKVINIYQKNNIEFKAKN